MNCLRSSCDAVLLSSVSKSNSIGKAVVVRHHFGLRHAFFPLAREETKQEEEGQVIFEVLYSRACLSELVQLSLALFLCLLSDTFLKPKESRNVNTDQSNATICNRKSLCLLVCWFAQHAVRCFPPDNSPTIQVLQESA